jgi:tRNA acetyltransferase TAN1
MKINQKGLEEEIEKFDLLIGFKEVEKLNNDELNIVEPEILGIEEIELTMNNTKSFFYMKESEFFDIVTLDLDINPVIAIEEFKKTPTKAIKKVIPIDLVVPTINEIILEDVSKLASKKIGSNESFNVKCELRKRRYIKSSQELICQVSDELQEKLNLNYKEKNADWIILIEELGKITGISICKAENLLIK